MDIINGPIVQEMTGSMIYQVTLASGMIITNPSGFGKDDFAANTPSAIISEGGKILALPKNDSKSDEKAGS